MIKYNSLNREVECDSILDRISAGLCIILCGNLKFHRELINGEWIEVPDKGLGSLK